MAEHFPTIARLAHGTGFQLDQHCLPPLSRLDPNWTATPAQPRPHFLPALTQLGRRRVPTAVRVISSVCVSRSAPSRAPSAKLPCAATRRGGAGGEGASAKHLLRSKCLGPIQDLTDFIIKSSVHLKSRICDLDNTGDRGEFRKKPATRLAPIALPSPVHPSARSLLLIVLVEVVIGELRRSSDFATAAPERDSI